MILILNIQKECYIFVYQQSTILIRMDLQEKPKRIVPEFNEHTKQIYDSFPKNIKDFYNFHGVQLFGCNFPISLVEPLYNKISKAISDTGQYLQIVDNEEGNTYRVRAKKQIAQQGNVFIVDHALTFRYPDLRKLLNQNPSLITRLTEMLKYHKNLRELPNQKQQKTITSIQNYTQIQFDNMQLTQLSHLQFPNNTVTLSLISNQLTNEEQLIKKMQYLDLKVLWINDNPIQDSEILRQYIKNKTKIQIYNSKFTQYCNDWGIKYVQNKSLKQAFNQPSKNFTKLNLDDRDIFKIDYKILNKFTNLHELSLKGHEVSEEQQRKVFKNILQSNTNLKMLIVDYQTQISIFDMLKLGQISKDVAKRVLINGHSLLSNQPSHTDLQIDQIQKDIFRISGCYRLASSQQLDQTSIWYVNDQVGSSIEHSDTPNVKMIPFLFSQDNKLSQNMWAYSIIWPLKPIKAGQYLYRDYLHGFSEQRQRSSRLAIWYKVPMSFFNNKFNAFDKNLKDLQKQSGNKIINFYKDNTQNQRKLIKKRSDLQQIYPEKRKMITDLQIVTQNLKHKQIQIVKSMQQAQIVWLTGALAQQQWPQFKQKYFVNQFPFQSCVVMKHHLADTIQSVLGNTPFLMRTYNLEKQLPEFIGEYYSRDEKGQDNLWILKPPNMARSLDMIITDNLSLIIKNMQTGPKIAQKYIARPVLRQGRKVDLRFILLVKSVNPLTMFLYKHFWIRSSNNPYTVDRRYLATYQTQFTVMNYGQVSDFKQIKYKDFIQEFQKDYAPHTWSQINQKIKKMLRNTFISASIKYPQMQNDKSRAMYGIDIMIDEETMEPKLLQITFSPDCKRACNYYPTFYDQVMQTLFLDIIGQNMERVI